MSIRNLSETTSGIVIGILLFALVLETVAIFYQAQTIAQQQAVIRMFEVRQ